MRKDRISTTIDLILLIIFTVSAIFISTQLYLGNVVSFLWLIIGFFALLFGISLVALMTALINHEVSLGFVLNTVIPDVVNNIVQKVFNDFPAFLNNSLIVAVGIYYTIISIYFSAKKMPL